MLVLFGTVLTVAGMFRLMLTLRGGLMFLSGLAAVIYGHFNAEGLAMAVLILPMVLVLVIKLDLLAFLKVR